MLTCENCIHFELCKYHDLFDKHEIEPAYGTFPTETVAVMVPCFFFIDRKLCIVLSDYIDNDPKNIEDSVKSIFEYIKRLRKGQSDD